MPKSSKSFAFGVGGGIVPMLAMAAGVTRDPYTATLEPIRKSNATANPEILS